MSPNYENTDQKIGSQRRYVATAVIIWTLHRSAQWSRYAKYPFLRRHDAGWENRFLDKYLADN